MGRLKGNIENVTTGQVNNGVPQVFDLVSFSQTMKGLLQLFGFIEKVGTPEFGLMLLNPCA